jgi:hypothetical protein
MIIVRNCFVAKPGHASKLAAQLKEAAAAAAIPKYRVLTDLTGDFNRVIMEYEAKNVSEFEARMKQYMTDEAFREKMRGYTDLWITGYREILQIA